MSVNERFELLINKLGLSVNAFSKEINTPTATIRSVVKAGSKPGFEILEKILTKFPSINPEWLLLGKGEMLKENSDTTPTNDHSFKARDISKTSGMQVVTHGGVAGSDSQIQILTIELENLKQRMKDKNELINQQQERIDELKETIRELKGK